MCAAKSSADDWDLAGLESEIADMEKKRNEEMKAELKQQAEESPHSVLLPARFCVIALLAVAKNSNNPWSALPSQGPTSLAFHTSVVNSYGYGLAPVVGPVCFDACLQQAEEARGFCFAEEGVLDTQGEASRSAQ